MSYEFSSYNLDVGDYNLIITNPGDKNHKHSSDEITFRVRNLLHPDIKINKNEFYPNEELILNVPDDVFGFINLTINKHIYPLEIVDGQAKLNLTNVSLGKYFIEIYYWGDGKKYSESAIFEYITINSTILSEDMDVMYKASNFSVKAFDNTGKILTNERLYFIINNNTYSRITNDDGQADLFIDFNCGTYFITTINPITNENKTNKIIIRPSSFNISLKVNVINNVVELSSYLINKDYSSDFAKGNLIFMIDNMGFNSSIVNNTANIKLFNLNPGNYSVKAYYVGDSNHISSYSNLLNFTLESQNIRISVQNITKFYNGSERFVVKITDNSNNPITNTKVLIIINGVSYDRTTNENGVASMAINLNSGIYNATTEYNGTKVYSTVIVNPTIVANDVTKIFRNNTQYYGKFTDAQGNLLKSTDVSFNINGVFYVRTTNEQGIARLNINLSPGTYILTAQNPSTGEMRSVKITVLPSIVENYDLTKYYKNDSQYRIRLLDARGNPVGKGVSVEFNINGVFYTRTSDENGYVKMNINLSPGTYIITANYNGLMVSNTITVKPILEAKNLNMKYKDGSKFETKLLDGEGNPYANQNITFNINGVFYVRTTDDNGIARLNINLMAGEYIITSIYLNGAAISNKVTISS